MTRTQFAISGVVALCLVFWPGATYAEDGPTMRPFQFADANAGSYGDVDVTSHYAPMSDGARLAVDVYLPTQPADGIDAPERFPTIVQYTPYNRATIDLETGRYSTSSHARYFTSRGYACVVADIRGTGASSGTLVDFMPQIGDDGKELIDWIAAQSWCDGNVGMMGTSYLGWSQLATASQKPAALKCIAPAGILLEGYTGTFPGGINAQGFIQGWSGIVRNMRLNKGSRPSKPVIDEDGDGELADEVPVDVNENGTFLDDGFPPQYSDGAQREEHHYYLATKEHEQNIDLGTYTDIGMFSDATGPGGYTAYSLAPASRLHDVQEWGLPIYHIAGWFDGFVTGTVQLYSTLESTNPQKMALFPGYHNYTGGPFWERLGHTLDEARTMMRREHLRFFDCHLIGIDNGIDDEPPIAIYVMHGGGWRFEEQWPLERAVDQQLFFDGGGQLSAERSAAGSDEYRADLKHASTYSTGGLVGGNRYLGLYGMTPKELPIRTEKDEQCLVYTSTPLDADMEVTGHPLITFWASSSADYGDFFVYLEDVDEDGTALLVTEGQHRAGFENLYDNDEIIPTGEPPVEIKPELPWHGYRSDQYVDRPFADGRIVKLHFDLHPTSWVFRRGHSVRVTLACADWPTFTLHEKLSPSNKPDASDNIVPTVTIYRDEERPSGITLRVVPRGAAVATAPPQP